MATTKTAPSLLNELALLNELSDLLASCPTPKQILDYHPSKKIQLRVRKLLAKNGEGRLTEDERSELDGYLHMEGLMRLTKAKIRVKKSRKS